MVGPRYQLGKLIRAQFSYIPDQHVYCECPGDREIRLSSTVHYIPLQTTIMWSVCGLTAFAAEGTDYKHGKLRSYVGELVQWMAEEPTDLRFFHQSNSNHQC